MTSKADTSKEGKWTLSIGCHRKTLMSRDTDCREHDSLENCKEDVRKSEEFWSSIGYYVWFARATGPNGEEVKLHEGTQYY